jgi:hypothetical protein
MLNKSKEERNEVKLVLRFCMRSSSLGEMSREDCAWVSCTGLARGLLTRLHEWSPERLGEDPPREASRGRPSRRLVK